MHQLLCALQVDTTLNEALKPKIIATYFGQTTLPATKLLQHTLSIKKTMPYIAPFGVAILLILVLYYSKKERCWNILTLIIFFSKCQKSYQAAKEANTGPETDFVQLLDICCSMFFDFQSKSNGTRSNVKVTDRWLFGKHLCFIWLRWIIITILCSGSGELELKCMLYHLALPENQDFALCKSERFAKRVFLQCWRLDVYSLNTSPCSH